MKKKIRKWIWDFLYDHSMMIQHTQLVTSKMRYEVIRDLCSRVSIDKMRSMLDEAEKSDKKYTTLARLLESNYLK